MPFPKHYLLHITQNGTTDSMPFFSQKDLKRFLRNNGVRLTDASLSGLGEDESLLLGSACGRYEIEILLEPKIPRDILLVDDRLYLSRSRYLFITSLSEDTVNRKIRAGELNCMTVGKNNRVYIEIKLEDA